MLKTADSKVTKYLLLLGASAHTQADEKLVVLTATYGLSCKVSFFFLIAPVSGRPRHLFRVGQDNHSAIRKRALTDEHAQMESLMDGHTDRQIAAWTFTDEGTDGCKGAWDAPAPGHSGCMRVCVHACMHGHSCTHVCMDACGPPCMHG